MNRFTIFLWSLLLIALSATIKTTASSSATISLDIKSIREESSTLGIISTVAGYFNLYGGSSAEGIAATSAQLDGPRGLALDKEGNYVIADAGSSRIKKVTLSSGIINTVAGTGVEGYDGDGGQATLAKLNSSCGVCFDMFGNIFIADSGNHRIRKVTLTTGVITTVAGNGKEGFNVDNVAAVSTALNYPLDVAVDSSGNIYFADTGNGRVRKVTASTGLITTIAGIGRTQVGIDSAAKIATKFYMFAPSGVTLDALGNVFIAGGLLDPCIFKVIESTGEISIVAGTGGRYSGGIAGFNGDDILATVAQLNNPYKVTFDSIGNMYISDQSGFRIRKITTSSGIITTVAGTGAMASAPNDGEGGIATSAKIYLPTEVAIDNFGSFYFGDYALNVIRKVSYSEVTPSTSVTLAPSVTNLPFAPVASTPTASNPGDPILTPSIPPTPTDRTPSTPSSPTDRTPSTPSTPTAPTPSTPSTPTDRTPSTPSTLTAPTPGIVSSVSTKAPSSSSSTNSATATRLHMTIMLLSSILILHLCRDA